MLLELIVTHYDEPWAIGKKLFDMLALQRLINFDDIKVTIVNDGEENTLPAEYFFDYPFKVEQIAIKHAGVSAARNAGIDHAEGKWVEFCDFDDMYASVYTLRNVLSVLDTDFFDMLWTEFYSEDIKKDGSNVVHVRGENIVFIHGKFFRLDFLRRSGVRFPEDMNFNEDSSFLSSFTAAVNYKRTGKINTDCPQYVWAFRHGSATGTRLNKVQAMIGAYQHNAKAVETFRKYEPYERFCAMVGRTVHDAYWLLNLMTVPDELKPYVDDFRQFYIANKKYYLDANPETMKEVAAISRAEHDLSIKEELERWGNNSDIENNYAITLDEWLKKIETGVC